MTVRGNDQQKTLVIIRHAQAEHGLGVADHERISYQPPELKTPRKRGSGF